MTRIIPLVSGAALAGLGLVFLPLPTPFGVPLLLTGGILILMGSPAAQKRLRRLRRRHRGFDRRLRELERSTPGPVRETLRNTDPDPEPGAGDEDRSSSS